MSSLLKAAQVLLDKLKAAYEKRDYAAAKGAFNQLKIQLIHLPALPPTFAASPTTQQELLLARDAYEHAVLLGLSTHDETGLERAFTQLKTYYADTRMLLPGSSLELPLLGLYLLRLLVQNRIAEFHTELELVPSKGLLDPYVAAAVQQEQWLMEGAYNKVLAASAAGAPAGASGQLPPELPAHYLQQLAATVREEIASCSERAYAALPLSGAAKLMGFKSVQEAGEYARERGWHVVGGSEVVFKLEGDAAAGGDSMAVDGSAPSSAGAAPSMTLINQALAYAKELERIV